MTLWVGELFDLAVPHKVVECVTSSALNAAIRGIGAPDTNVEREALRNAEHAPNNAGTDFAHAKAGLAARYKLASTEDTGSFAVIQAAIAHNASVLIRGTYAALPAAYRFQKTANFSHCVLLVPSKVSGNVFEVDPLDTRNANRPLGKDIPWAFIKAFSASGGYDCLIVPGPVVAEPTTPPEDIVQIAVIGGLVTCTTDPSVPYALSPGGPAAGKTPAVPGRYLVRAYSVDGKYVALDGLWQHSPLTPPKFTVCGWVPAAAVKDLAPVIQPAVAQRTVTGVTVQLSDGSSEHL